MSKLFRIAMLFSAAVATPAFAKPVHALVQHSMQPHVVRVRGPQARVHSALAHR